MLFYDLFCVLWVRNLGRSWWSDSGAHQWSEAKHLKYQSWSNSVGPAHSYILSPGLLHEVLGLSMWASLGFYPEWQPQGIWSAYTAAEEVFQSGLHYWPSGSSIGFCGLTSEVMQCQSWVFCWLLNTEYLCLFQFMHQRSNAQRAGVSRWYFGVIMVGGSPEGRIAMTGLVFFPNDKETKKLTSLSAR